MQFGSYATTTETNSGDYYLVLQTGTVQKIAFSTLNDAFVPSVAAGALFGNPGTLQPTVTMINLTSNTITSGTTLLGYILESSVYPGSANWNSIIRIETQSTSIFRSFRFNQRSSLNCYYSQSTGV